MNVPAEDYLSGVSSPHSCLCASVAMGAKTADYRDSADTPISGYSESECGL